MAKRKTTKTKKIKRLLKKDLDMFRAQLINMKEEILEQMKDISEDALMKSQKDISGDISGYSIHMADVATDNYDREFNLSLVSNERKTLLEIEDALSRIEDKTYGVCLKCDKLINKVRLKAIPYAKYCTRCQDEIERNNMG